MDKFEFLLLNDNCTVTLFVVVLTHCSWSLFT